MRSTFTGGRLFGIPIRINVSWFLSLAVLTGLLGGRVFPNVLPDLPPAAQWALGLATALTFFLSIILHELGHALVARTFGIPVRSITLFLLGGVAQIGQEAKRPLTEFLIAVVGPAVSLALAALCLGLMLLIGYTGLASLGHDAGTIGRRFLEAQRDAEAAACFCTRAQAPFTQARFFELSPGFVRRRGCALVIAAA